jgi:hypothetical protein
MIEEILMAKKFRVVIELCGLPRRVAKQNSRNHHLAAAVCETPKPTGYSTRKR